MTQKYLVAIAEALKSNRPGENWDANKRIQWNGDVKALVGVAKDCNPRFKEAVFFRACGGLFEV